MTTAAVQTNATPTNAAGNAGQSSEQTAQTEAFMRAAENTIHIGSSTKSIMAFMKEAFRADSSSPYGEVNEAVKINTFQMLMNARSQTLNFFTNALSSMHESMMNVIRNIGR